MVLYFDLCGWTSYPSYPSLNLANSQVRKFVKSTRILFLTLGKSLRIVFQIISKSIEK
jgi:hypothetical protein